MAQLKGIGNTGILQEALLNDKDFLKNMIQAMLQGLIEEEFKDHIGADPYERTGERQGYRNGYKPRTLFTRVGTISIAVPQARDGGFSTRLFERYQRSEKALVLSIIEMYIQGVSTRNVSRVAEELCGRSVSKSQVSRLAEDLDQELLTFRNRSLGTYPYLVIDARYEKVRTKRGVVSESIFIVAGINEEGSREILSVDISNAENTTNWADVFESLKKRGLKGVRFAVSDDNPGLVNALFKTFTGVTWQRCQCHGMKNLLDKVAKGDKAELKAIIRSIFDSPNLKKAREIMQETIKVYESRYPAVSNLLEEAGDSLLSCFYLPLEHRKRMRTTNMLERFNEEIKRRTRVVRIFPNDDAAIRLITALAAEQTEEWLASRKYLDMDLKAEELEQIDVNTIGLETSAEVGLAAL